MAGEEEVKDRIRNKLNQEKVKLWLPPYTMEDGSKGEVPQTLIDKYSADLELDTSIIMSVFEELRLHALEKLAARKKFQEKGIASLKIKLGGKFPSQEQSGSVKSPKNKHMLDIEIGLGVSGLDLKHSISQKTGVEVLRLKVICGGKVIEDDRPLSAQGVKHGCQMFCICLTGTEAEARRQQEQAEKLQRTREGAQLLSTKEDAGDDSNYYLQIADQTGKPLDLPKEERQALVYAMTLHEKGRAAVKKKNYGEALLLLLEADKEFSKCRVDILKSVDNYALVCLDIVWCYLCLKNVDDLPDAAAKLKMCDECFRRSYGPNLERLALVKGGTGTEKALFMRLHLLQGVLAFHQNNKLEAHQLLDRAEQELKLLQVDDESMSQVMAMGFTQHEARLALRMTEGNVQMAISHIMQKQERQMEYESSCEESSESDDEYSSEYEMELSDDNEEKKEIKKKIKEEKRHKKIAKKLRKTANGQSVNVTHYESLVGMGFGKGASAEALRQANNDLQQALQVLQDHPELLTLPDPDPPSPDFEVTDEMLAQLSALGFEADMVRGALYQMKGDVERAAQELLSRGGLVPQEWVQEAIKAATSKAQDGAGPSTSSGRSEEELEREKDLINSVIDDLPQDEEDHLDLTLEEEAAFLSQYKAYLASSS